MLDTNEPPDNDFRSISAEVIVQDRVFRNGIQVGMDHAAHIIEQYHEVYDILQFCELKIEVAAMCDHGPETRRILKLALEDMQYILPLYHRRLAELQDEPVLKIDPEGVAKWDAYYSKLIDYTIQYVHSERQLDQIHLQRFISQNNPTVVGLRRSPKDLMKGKKGPDLDPVKRFIGRFAAQCEEPGPGKFWWMIGKKLFNALSAKQPHLKPRQKETFEELQKYIHVDGTDVLPNQRTDLGTLVWRARKDHIEKRRKFY